MKRFRALACEKMKAEPAAVSSRNALGFPKEGYEQKENKVGVDLRLELEIAGKIFRCDFTRAVLELKCGVERVIDLFNEGNKRADVAIA